MRDRYDIYSDEEDVESFYDNRQYNKPDNAYKIKKVNEKRIKALKRKAIKRVAIFGMVAVGLVTAYKVTTKPDPQFPPIPEGYQEMMIDEFVDNGETIDEIAQKYYTEDVRTCYPDFEEYIEIILRDNNINERELDKQNSIKVPIIIDNNNYYLTQIKEKELELENVEEWIDYIAKPGDNLYNLSWEAASNGDEAMNNLKRITDINNLDRSSQIQIGQRLSIINPKIGELKREINSLKEEFNESITVNNEVKSK